MKKNIIPEVIILFIVRLKFQKQSVWKFVSRIPTLSGHSGGYNTPQLALGFIPVILTLSFLLINGCGEKFNAGMSAAAESKAMSLLKQYHAAQNAYRMQTDGRYGTLDDLVSQNLISDELANAFDSKSNPVPVNGYLFCEIASPDRYKSSGLCAYPKNGKGKVILMILNSSEADEWAFYSANSSDVDGAVHSWPSQSELNKFTKMRKYSPSEAAVEAQKMYDKAQSGGMK